MPLANFRCPDGVVVTIGSCMASCRMGRRCLTKPTLITIATGERNYSGTPSTTRLINGTMIEWLKQKYNYTIDPRSRAFSLLGTTHHAKLASVGGFISEIKRGVEITGTPDILEPDELTSGYFVLTDYKTYGSYKVAKVLGLVKESKLSTTEFYKTSGRWGPKGSPKKVTLFRQDPNAIEAHDEELQLNHYRLLLEEVGYPISHMQLQITVRDGGIQMSRERGVTELMYLVPVRKLPDDYIRGFFSNKQAGLATAVDSDIPPPICNKDESWNLRRCQEYCDVAEFCEQGKRVLSGELKVGY